jgi:hypothetical protein
MTSNFAQYTNGVQMPTGISEAGANIGRFAQQGLSSFGQSLGEGLQAYNENVAKDQVLQEEAKQLGSQIQQFAAQFGDSPEHAPFAKSLQPYIEQLAKVPSMSLTQKMGAVTGVKAAFANIGQQLQVFEMMRKERMARDMNTARGGVREFDEQTVPTAIIPSGKLPYFYNKNYTEQEGELVRLTNEAKARGASVDLPTVLDNWRKGLKANAMSRPDLPPQIKEALVKQIDAGEGLTDNIQTDESGVTDYAKEAEMYEKASTSVKEQLAPPKVEAPANKGMAPDKATEQTRSLIADTISKLEGMKKTKETMSDSEFNKLVDKDPAPSRYTKVANLEAQGWRRSVDDKGKVSWSKETENKQVSDALAIYKGELDKLPKPQKPVEDVAKNAEEELKNVNAQIKALEDAEASGDTLVLSKARQAGNYLMRKMGDASEWIGANIVKQALIDSNVNLNDIEAVRREVDRLGNEKTGMTESAWKNYIHILKSGNPFVAPLTERDITKKQEKLIDAEIKKALHDPNKGRFALEVAKFTGDTEGQKIALNAYKAELENRVTTGKINASPADVSKVQQVTKPTEAKPEPEYALTNQYNMTLGTTTASIATSLESKRNDMKAFFQNKYGYVPASFEESFKAIYPEANFKTMETPYGAFMYDGKEWKQIQIQQPKTMTPKEIAENKAVSFGKTIAGGQTDVNEFGELVPNSGVYVRGIFSGSPTEAFKFKQQMLEASNAKKAVGRLIEINDMVGESMPWNAKVWGEAKALLPQIKAGLRTDIIGVGTVSNYEQQLIEEVVADPTKFWSLESSDRAKLAVIMDKISNRLIQEPANHGLEVKVAGKPNAEIERRLKLGNAGKSKLELDFEARGGKKGVKLNWDLTNKIPDALKD